MSDKSDKTPRPGEAALHNMKLLKKESSLFKVPKVPKKKLSTKKAQVLDEDVYVEGISKIIQRDFFPDLEKLKAQNEFLEATENKDYIRLREITQKYSGSRPPTEPYNTPATFDTPGPDRPYSPSAPTVREQGPDPEESGSNIKTKDITDNHTLDSFLSSHTSEDNASYDRVIALEDKKRAAKLASQLNAEVTSAALADKALALPSIEEQADQTDRPHELDTWRYKAKNYIMYVPDGAAGQPPPRKPDLLRHNTRLRAEPFDHVKNKEAISAIARTQDASASGKIGVDGVSISSEKPDGAYEYLATPSPRPGDGPDQSPLMTWGHIEGTPFRLDGGDTPLPAVGAGAAYRMLEGGARERIALQLCERARRRRPTTPRSGTPRTPNLPHAGGRRAAVRARAPPPPHHAAVRHAADAQVTIPHIHTAYTLLTPAPAQPTACWRAARSCASARAAAAPPRRGPARRGRPSNYTPHTHSIHITNAGSGAAYRMLAGGAQLCERARRRRPTTPRSSTPRTPNFRTNTERLASMSPAARRLATKHLLSPRLKLTPHDMGILAHARSPTPRRRLRPSTNDPATPTASGSTENNITDNLLQINVAKRTRLKAQDFFQ